MASMKRVSPLFERSSARRRGRAKSRPRVGALVLLLGLWVGPALAEPLVIEARPVALDTKNPDQRRMGDLVYLGGLILTSTDKRFGGLSGLAIAADGQRMLAVGDHGHWVGARLIHDRTGALIGIGEAEITPLGDERGNPVADRHGDAEEIASLAGGGYAVSFERHHRIAIYPGDPFMPGNNRGALLTSPPELSAAPDNKGIEALTEIEPGRLLAVTEGSFLGAERLRGWVISSTEPPAESAILSYASRDALRPTAFAKIPGGDVLVLERAYSIAGGLRVRLMRLDATAIAPGAVLQASEIARFSGAQTADNFEGLAVHRDDRGRILIYMISDDNFSWLQRTLLLQFELLKAPS